MLFQKKKTMPPASKLTPIAEQTGRLAAFASEQLLFTLEGGAGNLCAVWYDGGEKGVSPYDAYSSSALVLNDTPLVQMQGTGCPTCASLLAAGYGLPEDSAAVQAMRDAMTKPYTGLKEALERLRPLVSLLPSGVYALSHAELCPTDGEGAFFWDVPGGFAPREATAVYYDSENYRTLPAFPCFLYPSQSARNYDPARVEHYRAMIRAEQPLPPVLTYFLESSLCVLLDGHHRACACALEGVRVPALTIARPAYFWRESVRSITWPDGSETALSQLHAPGLEPLLDAPMAERRHKRYPFSEHTDYFTRCWEGEYAQMARRYPTCYEVGVLGLYPEVTLTAEGIRKLAMDDDYEEPESAAQLLRFAARQQGADRKTLAMEFTQVGYPAVLRNAAYEVLDSVKDDPEIDDLMVEILVNCERKDDPIYRIADQHWETASS